LKIAFQRCISRLEFFKLQSQNENEKYVVV
jgi:hypothetical protein